MTSICSSNRTTISHILPQKRLIRSKADLQRLALRRSHPVSIEFRLEDNDRLNNASLKGIAPVLSKNTLRLKNPPIKEMLAIGNLTRHLRGLQLKPEDTAKRITEITQRFSRVRQLAIIDEHDSFSPIKIRKKVHPMKSLRSFIYDHEFCKDFMRCARYASEVKIRKTAVNFEELERLQRLETIQLILKTKYLSLPEEDKIFTHRLGSILLRLPNMKNVVLEQDVHSENSSYIFMELGSILKDKAKVSLIADFIDVSSQRNKNMTLEKIIHKIYDMGIENLKVNYAGVIKVMRRFERVFDAPIHTREDIYARFLKAVMDTSFKKVDFLPTVHSSHVDSQLKDIFVELLKSEHSLQISGLNITYNLDMIEADKLDLLLDLYKYKAPCYDITIISSCDLRKGFPDKIKEHYTDVFSKLKEANSAFSLRIVSRNLNVLSSMLKTLVPKTASSLLKAFNVQVIDPLNNGDLQNFFETLHVSGVYDVIKKIGVDFAQKEALDADSLYSFLSAIAQSAVQLNKLKLCYSHSRDCEQALKKAFERVRREYHRVDFDYEVNNERTVYE